MSAMRKAIQYLGFDVADRDDYDYGYDDHELAPVTHLHEAAAVQRKPMRQRTQGRDEPELQRIQTIKPRAYSDARVIGEAFRHGVPVIMNLTEMTDADAKRLVDFAAGLSFGLHGSLERVTTSVFLLSPAHVEIGVDQESAPTHDRSFYDQH